MAGATAVPLSASSQKAFMAYYHTIQNNITQTRGEQRTRFEKADRQYQREVDNAKEQSRAKAANDAGDTSRFQNMTVPVVAPQVESAVTYQASVFLTGEPLFGVVAAPAFMDAALQMESVIEANSIRGGWVRELMMFFRDGFKYEFAPLEVSWNQELTWSVKTDLSKSVKEGIPTEVLWSGNKLKRLNPYNTFVDDRVPASEVYKDGEFGGYTEAYSRIKLKSFIASLPSKIVANVVPAFESGLDTASSSINSESRGYYTPSINPTSTIDDDVSGTNWLKWAGIDDTSKKRKINYKDNYELTTIYCKILPSEFDLRIPNINTPQIFKLYIVNHQVIIYAELQTNAHNYLPIMVGSPLEDGLGYQTKSLAENAIPFQQLTTSYMTSIIASRRRSINDRLLFDPSRITNAHINSPNPSAKIPVRPAAYGKKISDAVYQFPYRDDQSASGMQQIQTILGLANITAGQNQAQQGQFVKGNKTLSEFESVMQNANGRDQLASMLIEHQCFTPIKHILKLNILQFQGGTTVYNRDKKVAVEIDPIKLREAVLEFRVSDGLVPSSKILNSEQFGVALQVFGSAPSIAQGYNIAPMFSYMMKTQGADIASFEKSNEQVAFEQATQQWQNLWAQAIDKGANTTNLPKQPLPADYGYDPANNTPQPKDTESGNPPPPGALQA
tara:strand:- start:4373 stop:6388 length:2016 start_codon:yes stop_codon:yes gene_type:complete